MALLSLIACTPQNYKGTDITGVDWGGDFELTAHTGQRLKTADLRGRVVVIFFGFSYCPDICSPTLTRLAQAMNLLGNDAGRVQVLFVTVDPKRDTPSQLAGFVPKFHSSFIGLTGTEAELAAVARAYRVIAMPGNGENIQHSDTVFVNDANGKLRLLFKDRITADDMAHDLKLLFKKTP